MRDKKIVDLVNTCWSDLQEARFILENNPSLVYERTSIDETALMLLLRWYSSEQYEISQHINAIKLLLDFGADINASNGCGSNSVHNAILSREIEVVKYLISKGADINPEYGFIGHSTLQHGILSNDIALVKYLLENGADINAHDDFGETPLHMTAAKDSKIEFTKLLIHHGADVNAINDFGYTPLDEAYSEGSKLNIGYLIDAEASINKITWDDIPNEIYKEEAYMELLKPLLEKNNAK